MSIETIRQGLEEIFSLPLRRLTVSNPRAGAEYIRIQGRPVTLRGQELLQLEKFTKTQAFHENLPLSEGPARLEALLAHIPGIRVVMPSNAYDAKGLLLRAIRDNNPVVFIEHKALYKTKCEVPEEPYECDYTCSIKREGSDVSIITYSAMVNQALKAADKLAEEGISAEVVDIRTIEPLDEDSIIRSVEKTGRAVVVHEACRKAGFGAELAAIIQEKAFNSLKKPVQRVGAPNVPVPFAPNLEKAFLPNDGDIIQAVRRCF